MKKSKAASAVAVSALAVFATLVLGVWTPAAAQDAKAGEKKTALCSGCHNIQGYQSSFPEIYKVPKISGQNAKYIVAALNAYKKGERKHPTMRAISSTLSDPDMADLAAFYEQQGREEAKAVPAMAKAAEPPADVAALLAKMNCVSCHGASFNTPIDPSYPKVAGQYSDYLYVALKAYRMDGNPHVGRANAIMMGMARPYTNRELRRIAGYLASLPGEIHTVQKSPFH